MRMSLEQMRAANQERQQTQQTAETRLVTLKVTSLNCCVDVPVTN